MRVLDYRTSSEAFADEPLESQDQHGRCASIQNSGGSRWDGACDIFQLTRDIYWLGVST